MKTTKYKDTYYLKKATLPNKHYSCDIHLPKEEAERLFLVIPVRWKNKIDELIKNGTK